MVSHPPPKPCRNHHFETAETTNETAPKPLPKPKPKPRNHVLKDRADGFGPASRGSELRRFGSRLGFATLALRYARRWFSIRTQRIGDITASRQGDVLNCEGCEPSNDVP